MTIKPLEDDESFKNVPTTVKPSRRSDVLEVCTILCIKYLFVKSLSLVIIIIIETQRSNNFKNTFVFYMVSKVEHMVF